MKALVSVIVPIYKAEKTLPDCINSILNQTYTDFELILVDDGSPDNCGKICDEYAAQDSRIRVIHKDNGGVSSARNVGMDNVQGEYFVCIDSDDIVAPCYLEDFITTQESHPEFGLVLCGFYRVSQKKNNVLTENETLSAVDRKDYMRLSDRVLIQGPCLNLYRTEVVQRNRLRMREDLSLAEDLIFNLEYLDALENTSIGVINKPNYIYQDEGQESLYHRHRKDLLEIKEIIIQSVKGYLIKWNIDDKESWESFYNSMFFNYMHVLENTFSASNGMSKHEKIKYNSSVMKRPGFAEAMSKKTYHVNPILEQAYQSGNYRCVMAVNYAIKLKYMLKD